MSSGDDDEWEKPTPIEVLPEIARDPSKKVVSREEGDRLIAALERRRWLAHVREAWRALWKTIARLFR